ncbi:hypothetical protein AX14_012311 [Amanita brunnescens Koide BX004]|nr:hypothetical protein AX14_012311 [Amanita brunnescens Koide BX004]
MTKQRERIKTIGRAGRERGGAKRKDKSGQELGERGAMIANSWNWRISLMELGSGDERKRTYHSLYLGVAGIIVACCVPLSPLHPLAEAIVMALFSSIMGLADLFTSNSTPEQSEVAQREGRDPLRIISDVVDRAKKQHAKYSEVMTTSRREMPGSQRLAQHALNVMDRAELAREAPCTHFMPDIARGVLQLMNELLLYAEYEAGHPIFRLMRDMQREANALEGKMQALQVLIEAELEWKQRAA